MYIFSDNYCKNATWIWKFPENVYLWQWADCWNWINPLCLPFIMLLSAVAIKLASFLLWFVCEHEIVQYHFLKRIFLGVREYISAFSDGTWEQNKKGKKYPNRLCCLLWSLSCRIEFSWRFRSSRNFPYVKRHAWGSDCVGVNSE